MSELDLGIDRDAFLRMQMGPEGSDEMNFSLRSADPDPEHFFSMEGVENVTGQIRDYVLARAMAHYRATGKAPKAVNLNVKLDWQRLSNLGLELQQVPWYGADDKGPTPMDGDSRVQAALRAVEADERKG